jgi:long-chain acyl-CoA synthetase
MDLAHVVYRSAQRMPDNILWITADDRRINYADGAQRISACANAILARTEQRSRVAILSTNRFEGFEAYLGVLAAGCVAVTMNPRGHEDDYRHAITDSGASVLIVDAALTDKVEQLRSQLPSIEHWISFGAATTDTTEGYAAYEDVLAEQPQTRPTVTIDPDDAAWLFYTSGTTGRPKGAIETHRNLLAMIQHFMLELGADLGPDDVMLHLAPISHGSCSVGLPHLAVGAANAFPASLSFDPGSVFAAIEKLGVTATMLAPTMIRLLLDSPDWDRYDVSSLKSVVYGAAPMPVADLERALEAFGPVFIQFYGQAEAAATITCLRKSDHRLDGDEQVRKRLGSAGRETFQTRVRIVGPDGSSELPAGEIGEITVRGALVMPGYWQRPDATAETIRDGWLFTGDAGYLDTDGYLFITDRIKDMFISGGSNIYAREVEDVLLRHPGISQIAVIGIPDEKWGDVVAAVVVPEQDATLTKDDVVAYARAHMASYKKPHHVWFVDSLPTSAYGKVLKKELKKTYSKLISAAHHE